MRNEWNRIIFSIVSFRLNSKEIYTSVPVFREQAKICSLIYKLCYLFNCF